jgi:hypothetical protein
MFKEEHLLEVVYLLKFRELFKELPTKLGAWALQFMREFFLGQKCALKRDYFSLITSAVQEIPWQLPDIDNYQGLVNQSQRRIKSSYSSVIQFYYASLHRKYTFVYLALLKSNLIGRNREGWF